MCFGGERSAVAYWRDEERRGGNMYYGYRTAITRSGDWQFFIAGD